MGHQTKDNQISTVSCERVDRIMEEVARFDRGKFLINGDKDYSRRLMEKFREEFKYKFNGYNGIYEINKMYCTDQCVRRDSDIVIPKGGVVYGPYVTFPAGNYAAIFEIDGNLDHAKVFVESNNEVLFSRTASECLKSDKGLLLPFNLDQTTDRVELKVSNEGEKDLVFRRVIAEERPVLEKAANETGNPLTDGNVGNGDIPAAAKASSPDIVLSALILPQDNTEFSLMIDSMEDFETVDVRSLIKYDGIDFIKKAYLEILNREADISGLKSNADMLEKGTAKTDILQNLAYSDEGSKIGKILYGFDEISLEKLCRWKDRKFITACYYQILRRGPDSSGMNELLPLLRNGKLSKSEIAFTLENSPENQKQDKPVKINKDTKKNQADFLYAKGDQPELITLTGSDASFLQNKITEAVDVRELLQYDGIPFIQSAYRAILDREADENGLCAYINQLISGVPKENVLYDLSNSDEGKKAGKLLYGFDEISLERLCRYSDRDFITAAFYQILRRSPDSGGMETYLNPLRKGELSKSDIAFDLADSDENQMQENPVKINGERPHSNLIEPAGKIIQSSFDTAPIDPWCELPRDVSFFQVKRVIRKIIKCFTSYQIAFNKAVSDQFVKINGVLKSISAGLTMLGDRIENLNSVMENMKTQSADLHTRQDELMDVFDRKINVIHNEESDNWNKIDQNFRKIQAEQENLRRATLDLYSQLLDKLGTQTADLYVRQDELSPVISQSVRLVRNEQVNIIKAYTNQQQIYESRMKRKENKEQLLRKEIERQMNILQQKVAEANVKLDTLFISMPDEDKIRKNYENLEKSIEAMTAKMKEIDSLWGKVGEVDKNFEGIWANEKDTGQNFENLWNKMREVDDNFRAVWSNGDSVNQNFASLWNSYDILRKELFFEIEHRLREGSRGNANVQADQTVEPRILDSGQKKIEEMGNNIRLNLGSGTKVREGYINVDGRELPGVDVVANVERLPFEEDSVQEIMSEHLIEHFTRMRMEKELLPYWNSLLKPGGLFRVIFPDSEAMIKEYNAGNMDFEMLGHLIMGAQDYDSDYHFAIYSPDVVITMLEEAGFQKVELVARGRENGGCKESEIIAYKMEKRGEK